MTDPEYPHRLTAVVSDARDMLDKLWFNIQVFEWALSEKDGGTAQGFAVLDYAQASCAMHQWVCEAARDADRPSEHEALINLPWAKALRAIANGSKHRKSEDKSWPGGAHYITYRAGDDAEDALDQSLAELDDRAEIFLRLIVEGSAWGESMISDPQHPEGVGIRRVLLENYEAWHKVVMAMSCNE